MARGKEKYAAELQRWLTVVDKAPDYVKQKAQWEIDAHAALIQNQPLPPRPVPAEPSPVEPRDPAQQIWPGTLYNGMIAPLVPYALKGVIWYQGEAHCGHAGWHKYAPWFAGLIEDWREKWGQGDFTFPYVQLAGHVAPANALQQPMTAGPASGTTNGEPSPCPIPAWRPPST